MAIKLKIVNHNEINTVETAPPEEGNPSTVKINRKMAMLAELAALPAKPECLTNDELLKAIERVHKASITAAYDFDRLFTSDEKEFIVNVDRALKAVASQRKINVYEEIGDAIFRIDDEIIAESSNRLIIASQWRYVIKPEAFDAMIEQLEKDAATVDGDESIFPDPADIEPNMIVPTLAQAVEWRPALSNIDLTAAYQLAVLTHSKMTILTKERWLVEECLNAFEEEARNRGVNILPLDTVDNFKFNLQSHADDETEKALDYIVDGVAQSYFKLTHIEEEGVDTHCDPSNKLAALNVIHMHAMYKFAVKHGEIALADQYLYQIDRFLKVIGIDRVNNKTNRFKFNLQRHADDETERVNHVKATVENVKCVNPNTVKSKRKKLIADLEQIQQWHFSNFTNDELIEMLEFCGLMKDKFYSESNKISEIRQIKRLIASLEKCLYSECWRRGLDKNPNFAHILQLIQDKFEDLNYIRLEQLFVEKKVSKYAQRSAKEQKQHFERLAKEKTLSLSKA